MKTMNMIDDNKDNITRAMNADENIVVTETMMPDH